MFETWEQGFLAVLVLGVFVSFLREWLPVELVALLALFACVAAGAIPLEGALSVFGHPAPLTVGCMFILSGALERTGVVDAMADWFEAHAARTPIFLLVVLMLVVAGLSGFMNNTPVVVVFLPIVLRICRRKDWMASRFLIPLSYAAIVGGTITIIGTSTNLIAAGIMEKEGYPKFGMFEVTPLGIIFVIVTFIYMLTIGRKLLPDRSTLASLIDTESTREFITHAYVKEGSKLVGQAFPDSSIAKLKKTRIIEVRRDHKRLTEPLPEIVFEVGDEIVLKGNLEAVVHVQKAEGLAVRGKKEEEDYGLSEIRTESAVLMEGIIGPDSTIAGKSLKELNFRQRFGVLILAVHRRGRNLQERFEDEKLAFGDTILVQGPAEKMRRLFEMKDFINLSEPERVEIRPKKAPLAVIGLGLFVILGALGGFEVIQQIPVVLLAMGASLFVLVTGCLTPKEAYSAIEWRVLFLIFGMLALGLAMKETGLATLIAQRVMDVFGTVDPRWLVLVIYVLAMVLTEVVSNNAVAALLTPLAIVLGLEMGVDPRPFVIAVMFGSSASFMTPIGYQTNTFVYGAGGYKFGDFFRTGALLSLLLAIVASLLIPLIWKF